MALKQSACWDEGMIIDPNLTFAKHSVPRPHLELTCLSVTGIHWQPDRSSYTEYKNDKTFSP